MRLKTVQQILERVTLPSDWKIEIGEPWTNYFKNANQSACTVPDNKTIYLYKKVIRYFNESTLNSTIAHEVAHALTMDKADHGRDWYYAMIKLGGSLESEFEFSQAYFKNRHKKMYDSFKVFLKVKRKRDEYFIPKKYLK